jgi:hypothetical protein
MGAAETAPTSTVVNQFGKVGTRRDACPYPPHAIVDPAGPQSQIDPHPMAASTRISLAVDPVKQFSVFVQNRVGRLFDLTALLKDNNVHIMAVTVLDTTDSAIVRLVVDDPDKARELMVNNDFPYTECDILAIEITDESEFRNVLAALFEAEINIHYVYSFIKRPDGKHALAINAEDTDVAAQALGTHGFKVLTQRDISR